MKNSLDVKSKKRAKKKKENSPKIEKKKEKFWLKPLQTSFRFDIKSIFSTYSNLFSSKISYQKNF